MELLPQCARCDEPGLPRRGLLAFKIRMTLRRFCALAFAACKCAVPVSHLARAQPLVAVISLTSSSQYCDAENVVPTILLGHLAVSSDSSFVLGSQALD